MKQQPQRTQAKGTVNPSQLLSVQQVCERFGVSQHFVYMHLKELPHYRLGSRVKFSEAELLRFFKRASCEERL
jgi:excisionase family DNA binding protein